MPALGKKAKTIVEFAKMYDSCSCIGRRQGQHNAAQKEAGKLKNLYINCLVCHNRNTITRKWQDDYPETGRCIISEV